MDPRILSALVFGLSAALSIAGCSNVRDCESGVGTGAGYDAALRARGEAVFRLQNSVMDALIEAAWFEAELPAADAAALVAVEKRLIHSCRALNEAAAIRARGGQTDLLLKLRAFDSLNRCERSAQAAQDLLHKSAAHAGEATP